MVAPVVTSLLASLGGMIATSLTFFVANKLPKILAAIGFSFVTYKGLDKVLSSIIGHIQSVGGFDSIDFYGNSINVFGLASSCGIFDALNIVLSGYSSLVVLIMTSKVFKYVGATS